MTRLGLGLDPDPLFADLIAAVGAVARDMGIEPVDIRTPDDIAAVDRLLLVGRPGRYRALLSTPGRPATTIWTGEPLPGIPPAGRSRISPRRRLVRRGIAPLGSPLRRLPLPSVLDRRRVAITTERLLRANLDELVMAAREGARLVVTSRDRGSTLASWGLSAGVVPFGYHERHAGPLTAPDAGERDVPLLVLASRATHTRRAATMDGMHRAGVGRGLRVVEGVWGHDREVLLRRTRVVLDVHRIPGNFVGLRLLLSLAAGAALVTEPMTDPYPFMPGVHYLEATGTDLLGVADGLAADEPKRRRLVEAGQALLRDELTMRASLASVLAVGSSA